MSELIPIADYTDLPSAYLARAKLEGSGIHCFLDNEHLVGVNWLYSGAVGGVYLSVYKDDLETALELLAEKFEAEGGHVFATDDEISAPEQESLAPEDEDICPCCASHEVEYRNFGRAFAAASLMLAFALPFSFRRNKCKKCGFSWKVKR